MMTVCVFVDVIVLLLNTVKLSELLETNQRKAYTDSLTGIGNRMAFDKKFASLKVIPKEKLDFGIIMFDVNDLKYLNDTFGHEKGDTLIIESARVIDKSCVGEGVAYRYGGYEIHPKKDERNIDEIIKIADKKMYECKALMKLKKSS